MGKFSLQVVNSNVTSAMQKTQALWSQSALVKKITECANAIFAVCASAKESLATAFNDFTNSLNRAGHKFVLLLGRVEKKPAQVETEVSALKIEEPKKNKELETELDLVAPAIVEEPVAAPVLSRFEQVKTSLASAAESAIKTARAHPHVTAAVVAAGIFSISVAVPALLIKLNEKIVVGDLSDAFDVNVNRASVFGECAPSTATQAVVKNQAVMKTMNDTIQQFRLLGKVEAAPECEPRVEIPSFAQREIYLDDQFFETQARQARVLADQARESSIESLIDRFRSDRLSASEINEALENQALIVPRGEIRSLPEAILPSSL